MAYLARKITLSKWEEVDGGISSDVLGTCLRTKDNQLSFWMVNNHELSELENVVLGVAASPDIKAIQKQTIILIDEQFFIDNGFSITNEDGEGLVEDIKGLHRNLSTLNHKTINILADKVFVETEAFNKLGQEDINDYFTVKTFYKDDVVQIFKKAVADGRMDLHSIKDEKVKDLLSN